MAISVRAYVFEDGGAIKRVPKRVSDALSAGLDAIPAYANTRQKIATAIVENEDGKPVRILDVSGSVWTFDDKGMIHESLIFGAFEAMETHEAVRRSRAAAVVDLRPQIKRKEWEARNRWNPTKEDIDRIAADLWPSLADAPEITTVKGKAAKRPPVTYEAERALEETSQALFKVLGKAEDLSEPALRGFVFEAHRHARTDPDPDLAELWLGVAKVAERQREIKARHRTGKGAWYAVLRLWQDGPERGIKREIKTVDERHESRTAAVDGARRLLAEYANRFAADVDVTVEVLSDLEWQPTDESREQG